MIVQSKARARVLQTINLDAPRLDQVHNSYGSFGLLSIEIDVVVIVVQLDVRVDGGSNAEGNGQEGLPYDAVEDAIPVISIFLEGFIDHVPSITLPLPMRHQVRNVILHDRDERCVVEATVAH
jgi:hypothetical protein